MGEARISRDNMSTGRTVLRTALFLGICLLSPGCLAPEEGRLGNDVDSILGSVTSADLQARSLRNGSNSTLGYASAGSADARQPAIYSSTRLGVVAAPAGADGAAGDSVNLNFQGAELRDVVQAILGDTLGQTYTIDPKVTGTVTLSTARPVPRDDLVSILETMLEMNGADLVRRGNAFQIVEAGSSVAGQVSTKGRPTGFGITVVPLRYVSAQALSRLVDGFGARPGTLRIDTTRNAILIAGSGPDREAALETVTAFDVDWMKDQSVAVLPLQHARPEAVIPELERIFASKGSNGDSVIQFMSMPRLRAVLAVSQNRALTERAHTWVRRLDRENPDLGQSVHVYRVKYRDATKIAELLQRLFAANEETESDDQQTAPDEAAAQEPAVSDEEVVDIDPARFGGSLQPELGAEPVRIRSDPSNNSIVIYADLEMRKRVLAALTRIDVPQLQVAISVTMAEVRLTDELRFGVQYFVKSKSVGLGTDEGSFGLFKTLADNIAREVPGFNFVLGANSSPDVIISALDKITDVQILSSPSLVVLENEVARFQVGDQIPIITRTVVPVETADAPVSNQVEYRDTGIIMNVRPRIAENGVVAMRIDQEISNAASGDSLTPVISNRSISSSVSVLDGQTVLLGGLISETQERGKDGIPFLSRLKHVGNLFGSKNRSNARTELLIMIRPMVIRDSRDAQSVAEELQARMWGMGSRALK